MIVKVVPQQCADLPRLATPVSLGQDASFLSGRELPASGDRDQFSGLGYGLHYRFSLNWP